MAGGSLYLIAVKSLLLSTLSLGTVTAGNFLNETGSDTCAAFGTYCKREYSTGVDPVCFATATSNTFLSQDNTVARRSMSSKMWWFVFVLFFRGCRSVVLTV